MTIRIVCRKNEFHDSMVLMRINESVRQMDGVVRVAVLMGTENNKKILFDYGFWVESIQTAGASDLVIAVEGIDDKAVDIAFERVDQMFAERAASRRTKRIFKTQNAALRALPGANLVMISIPGRFAALEARKALKNGLNVFLFSDNVPLDDEISLKKMALEKNLLMMGPDCGTAIINGKVLGFANHIRHGEIGIVGASGTGIQEVSTQIHRLGMGISHAIGTGGRDLSKEIGGISMFQCIDLLLEDPQTHVIVLVSKPPDDQVKELILNRARDNKKPFVINFVGTSPGEIAGSNCYFAETLEEAAKTAVSLITGKLMTDKEEIDDRWIQKEVSLLHPRQKYLRGIFSGSTLAYEAISVFAKVNNQVYSNIALDQQWRLNDSWKSVEHTVVDMGDDEFTQGRAHPMIDPSLLIQRLRKEASDPEVACILMDCILGLGAHPDPGGIISPVIKECKEEAGRAGRHLPVILSICGTEEDPQVYSLQEGKFRKVGAIIQASNAKAAQTAGLICRNRG